MTPPPKKPANTYEEENGRMHNWRPVADPTRLTTEQLMREITSLKELLQEKFDGVSTRMDGQDKAVVLLQDLANRQPTVAEVVAKSEEKFNGIQVQFRERDQRIELAAKEAKSGVDAAFAAQKEAVSEQNKSAAAAIAKSEAATTKQIDAIAILISSQTKATDDKIDDLKSRLTSIEGRGQAYSQGFGWIATGVGIVAAIIGAIIAVFFKTGISN